MLLDASNNQVGFLLADIQCRLSRDSKTVKSPEYLHSEFF